MLFQCSKEKHAPLPCIFTIFRRPRIVEDGHKSMKKCTPPIHLREWIGAVAPLPRIFASQLSLPATGVDWCCGQPALAAVAFSRPQRHPCMHASIHPCINTSIHPSIHPYLSMHPYIHPASVIDLCMHACIHQCIHPCIHPLSFHPCIPNGNTLRDAVSESTSKMEVLSNTIFLKLCFCK